MGGYPEERTQPAGNLRVDAVLKRLSGVMKVRDGWMARCPAHEDREPSLHVTADGERILLHCFAGCRPEAVVRAAGLAMTDLFRQPVKPAVPDRRIKAIYDYTDAGGRLLFQVVRFAPKDFRQRQPDGAGDWLWHVHGITPVLFRLPRVITAIQQGETVFIVEGEKDVLTLEAWGATATCNAGGAGHWREEYSRALCGARVVILPDNDDAGRRHAAQVAAGLRGIAGSVRILELPDLPPKGDISDWARAGHTREELRALLQETPVQEAREVRHEPAPSYPAILPCTDLGNAERLVAAHGHALRYHTDAARWLVWTGRQWTADTTGEVFRRAAAVVRAIQEEAERLPGELHAALSKHGRKSESAFHLKAMECLARFQPGMPVCTTELDCDTWLLNCQNGTLDLRTGVLQPHAAERLCARLAPVPYEPDAPCPRWERFLREVFQEDAALMAFAQRLAGYLLTGETSEQAVFFLVGKGANGKSVFLETLRALLGEYARDTSFATFLETNDQCTADLAALVGARMVTASEAEGKQAFNETRLKRLTGGDPLTCRFLYQNYFTYLPTYKVLFATNEMPRLTSQGYALRRRMHVLPFRQTFYALDDGRIPFRDEGLRDRLRKELPGIFAWAVRGCRIWQAEGLNVPPAVREETGTVFASLDPLADFLDACCERHAGLQVETGALWQAYLGWCNETQTVPAFRAANIFSRALAQRDGIESYRTPTSRCLVGIGLR